MEGFLLLWLKLWNQVRKNYVNLFLFAVTDKNAGTKGISAFIVEKETRGLSVGKTEDKMGLCASDTTDLVFGTSDGDAVKQYSSQW